MTTVPLVEVNPPLLENDIKRLRAMLAQTRNHMARLQDQMEMMNTMWSGAANTALQQRFHSDYWRMLSLCASIEELIEILESIRRAYDACENDVRSMVYSLRI